MYLEHFGLRESPFRITPHTEFFFSGANRGATLGALTYAITNDEGIVKVCGEVGSGKTMLCRMLLERLPPHVDTVYLANPSLSRDELRYAIAEELQIDLSESRSHTLVRTLQDHLIALHAQGRQVVILIDEAHAMPSESLEEIRLLSNLETNRHKLLHIVLFGQPELDERLSAASLRQLKERITHNFALEPLRRDDVGTYLMFRLRAAGYHGPDLFTPGAIRLLSHASEGLTRRINILADKALLSAFSESTHLIDRRQVKAAVRDAQFKPMRDIRAQWSTWLIAGMAAAIAAAFLAGSHSRAEKSGTAPVSADDSAAVPTHLPSPATAVTATPSPLLSNIDERIVASETWLKERPDSHHFIQLLRTDDNSLSPVEAFLREGARGLDPQRIHLYRSRLSGRDRLGVIYGDFPTAEEAQTELNRIRQSLPGSGFYIRTFSKLR